MGFFSFQTEFGRREFGCRARAGVETGECQSCSWCCEARAKYHFHPVADVGASVAAAAAVDDVDSDAERHVTSFS